MPYAVELLLDVDAAERVRSLWERLTEAGIPSRLLEIESTPHVTLAVYDDLDPDEARGPFTSFAAEETPEPVSLYSPGAFPGPEGVLYLAPVVTRGLLELHAGFHERFAELDEPTGKYFFPGAWVPHVTAGLHLTEEQLAAGFSILRQADLPIEGRLDRLELLEFQRGPDGPTGPLNVHYRLPLGG